MRILTIAACAAAMMASGSTANATVVNLDLRVTGNYAGNSYSTVVNLQDQFGINRAFTATIDFTPVGGALTTSASTGAGVGDAFINNGEDLDFDVSLTPLTSYGVGSFSFVSLTHGAVVDPGPGLQGVFANKNLVFAELTGGAASNVSSIGAINPAQDFNLITSAAASVNGIRILTFDATAIPEPSTFAFCGMFAIGGIVAARRRKAKNQE